MNCVRLRRRLVGETANPGDPEVRRHLEGCAECRAYLARDAAVVRLLALKRLERPDPMLEARVLARIRSALSAPSAASAYQAPAAPAPAMAWRYALAAVLLLLLGLDQTLLRPRRGEPGAGAPVVAGVPERALETPQPTSFVVEMPLLPMRAGAPVLVQPGISTTDTVHKPQPIVIHFEP